MIDIFLNFWRESIPHSYLYNERGIAVKNSFSEESKDFLRDEIGDDHRENRGNGVQKVQFHLWSPHKREDTPSDRQVLVRTLYCFASVVMSYY